MDSLQDVREYRSALINGKMWYICMLCEDHHQINTTEADIVRHIMTKHPSLPTQTADQSMPAIVADNSHQPWTSPSIDRSVHFDANALGERSVPSSGPDDSGRYAVDTESETLDIVIPCDPIDVQPMVEVNDTPIVRRKRSVSKKLIVKQSKLCYPCPHEGCQYKCGNRLHLDRHVVGVHWDSSDGGVRQPYRCDVEGCGRAYRTKQRLRSHLADHRCGYHFDSDPTVPVGPCHRSELAKYRGQRVNKAGKTVYWCRFKPCLKRFRTKGSAAIMDHIHGQHVCPLRNDPSINGRTGRTALVSIPGPSGGQTVGDTQSGGTTAVRTVAKAVAKTAVKKLSKRPAKKQKKRNVNPNRGSVVKSTSRRRRTVAGSVGRTDIRFNRPLSSAQRISMIKKALRERAVRSASRRRSPVIPAPSVDLSIHTPNNSHESHNSLEADADIASDDEVIDEWRADACGECDGGDSPAQSLMCSDNGFVYEWTPTPDGLRCVCLTCAFPAFTVNSCIIHVKNTHLFNA